MSKAKGDTRNGADDYQQMKKEMEELGPPKPPAHLMYRMQKIAATVIPLDPPARITHMIHYHGDLFVMTDLGLYGYNSDRTKLIPYR